MNDENVQEWLHLADDDLYSAKILSEAVRKPYEIICYHCAQAAEKYLKGFLTYANIVPIKKTHDLVFLYDQCFNHNQEFLNVKPLCEFLNRFANDTRYPHKYEVNENDMFFCISAAEKIKNLKPILDTRKSIQNTR